MMSYFLHIFFLEFFFNFFFQNFFLNFFWWFFFCIFLIFHYQYDNIWTENKAEKRKSNQAFVQVNTQIFMMCPLSVLKLKKLHDENSVWPRLRLAIFYFGFQVGVTLQAPESFLTMVENQRVRHPDPIGIRFDPSGRISRVVAEVRPHEDWLLLHPLSLPTTGVYCLTVWMCVYCAKQWYVCG